MHAASLARLTLVLSLLACERRPSEAPDDPPAPEPTPVCEGDDRLAEGWSVRRGEVEAVLRELPGEWPRRLLDTLDRRFAAASPAWSASYAQACAERDEPRRRCLERQADEFDALALVLVRAPELAAQAAPWAEVQLQTIAVCETPSLPSPGPLPAELGTELSVTSLWFALGQYPRAIEGYEALIQLHALVDDPVYVFTLETMASVLELAYGNRESAAQRHASLGGKLEQVGPRERATYEYLGAMLAAQREDRPGATTAFERMVAAEREYGDELRLATGLENLATVRQRALADTPGAIAALTEAIGIYTRVLGSESAHVAQAQVALADVQVAAGRFDLAQDLLLQARDGFSAALGSDHVATHEVVLRLGRLMMAAGRPSDAYHAFLDLLEISLDQYGERDVRVAEAKLELAEALRAMGEHEGARVTMLEALPILVEGRGADHRSVAQVSIHLGQSLIELGAAAKDHELLDEAEGHCTRGRSLALALPDDDPLRADAERCLSELGRARKATGKRKPKPKNEPKPEPRE